MLFTDSQNAESNSIYQKLGFEITGEMIELEIEFGLNANR